MVFKKGESGNPGGKARHRLVDGKSLTELAREHTKEALETILSVMRNEAEPGSTRITAADKVLNRGWGTAPQTIIVDATPQAPDLSGMTNEQLEALETLRTLAPLEQGTAGSC